MRTDARSADLEELIRDLPLPLAILAVDLHGDVILWKSEMERLFGWSEAEVLGRPIPFFPDGLNGEAAHLLLKADSTKGRVAPSETILQRRDGSLVDVGVLSAPLPDNEGNIVGTVISVRDITDRKFAEEALRASEAKYRELFQSAHDVIAILDADGRVVDVNRRAVELTGYSRSELVGKTVRQDIAVPDDRLILETVLTDAMEGKESNYEPTVVAHRDELTRVFQNLIGNAIKFAKPDVAPRIDITSQPGDGEWQITASDNGIGIEPEYHSKVFDMFTRLHTIQTYPGTGAGLALCRKIVEGHGGRIWVDSTPGKGARSFSPFPLSRTRVDRFLGVNA